MRGILIYSQYDARQTSIVEDIKFKFPGLVETIEVSECPDILRKMVRETPAYITADEHLQGEYFLATDSPIGLIEATIYERMDMAEKALHNVNNERLDSHIIVKQVESKNDMLMEMIVEGVI